jgi:hypothetical protein
VKSRVEQIAVEVDTNLRGSRIIIHQLTRHLRRCSLATATVDWLSLRLTFIDDHANSIAAYTAEVAAGPNALVAHRIRLDLTILGIHEPFF